MDIPKIDFWKLTKASFLDSHKGARLSLELVEPVLAAIEQLDLPLQEESAEPEDPAEWKKWNALYDDLYDALRDIHKLLKPTEDHCRQNNEMWATYENLLDRYKQLHSRYGNR